MVHAIPFAKASEDVGCRSRRCTFFLLVLVSFITFGHTLKRLFCHKVIQDTRLILTGCFVPGERKPSYFSKFRPVNTDTPLIRTLSMAPSVSVLTGFDCIKIHQFLNRMMESTETKAVLSRVLFFPMDNWTLGPN